MFVFVLSSGGGGGGFNSSGRSGTDFKGTNGKGGEVVRDFFREGRVGDHCITMLLVGLVEEVELMESQEGEEEEGTLGEAVEMVLVIAVGVGVGSYNDGNNQDNECCYKTAGHCQVTITLL